MSSAQRIVCIAAVIVATAATAGADVSLQSFGGARPKDADRILQPFVDELEQQHVAALPSSVGKHLGGRLPREASDPTLRIEKLAKSYDYALTLWRQQPKLDALLKPLETAVAMTLANPGFLVADPTLRNSFKSVLGKLAIVYQRDGQTPKSDETERELIRTFPDEVFNRTNSSPEGERLYDDTRANLSKVPRGTLTVMLNDPTLQVYVNEVIRRAEKAIADLVPGTYRVVVVDRNNRARRFDVDVLGGEDSVLHVDWPVDSALVVTPEWIGFLFSTEADRAHEAELARRLVSRVAGDQSVIVVGIQGTAPRQLVASRYGVHGGVIAKGYIELGQATDDVHARDLAGFVASGETAEGVTVLVPFTRAAPLPPLLPAPKSAPASPVHTELRHQDSPTVQKWPPILLIAGGLVAIGAGSYLIATDEDPAPPDGPQKKYIRNSGPPGVAATIAGGALVIGGALWGYHSWRQLHPTETRKLATAFVGTGIAGVVAGALLLQVDEEDDGSQPQYRDTALGGTLTLGGGVVVLGIGAWLWFRGGDGTAAPMVAGTRGGAVVGFGGSF